MSQKNVIDNFSKEKKLADLESTAAIAFVVLAEGEQIDEETIAEHPTLFNPWCGDAIPYKTGQLVQYESDVYKVITPGHTSQADWKPPLVPALFKKCGNPADEWPLWSQPLGAHDAYNTGDKVSHKSKHWVCSMNGNVWEPGVHGWTEAV